jgi:hypothetical protein
MIQKTYATSTPIDVYNAFTLKDGARKDKASDISPIGMPYVSICHTGSSNGACFTQKA